MTDTVLHLKKTAPSQKRGDQRRSFHSRGFKAGPSGHHDDGHRPHGAVTGSATRAAAALCVSAVENGVSLQEAMPSCLKELSDERDCALAQEIVYGTLRNRRLLSERLKGLQTHSIIKRFEAARALILCAMYQICFTRVPAHAVVASTAGACQLCRCTPMTGMVNAVLRRFLREGGSLNEETQALPVRYSVPDWLFNKLNSQYPEKCEEILKAQNERAPLWVRAERGKNSAEAYLKRLSQKGIEAETSPLAPDALRLKVPLSAKELPGFDQGEVSVQDLAAQLAAPLLGAQDGERILDPCCAPGGKSAHLLALCPNCSLTCMDLSPQRLESAKENFARLGLKPRITEGDFSAKECDALLEGPFDRILLDAPCSGTGVIRRHPDIRWLRRERDIAALAATQAKMLDHAADLLKSGGTLVYTTCSILEEENLLQVQEFLKRRPAMKPAPFAIGARQGYALQRLPGEDGGDGFFYARFVKA